MLSLTYIQGLILEMGRDFPIVGFTWGRLPVVLDWGLCGRGGGTPPLVLGALVWLDPVKESSFELTELLNSLRSTKVTE